MVKLRQCFLLVAIGLATAASAAAIAKGNEQSVNIERRSVDTRHAQEIARRAIDGDGQRWMEPGSAGQESDSPRRRTTDSDNGSRVNSGDGTNPPSRQSVRNGSGNGGPSGRLTNADDAKETDPSLQQLKEIINADAEQQLADFFAQYGHCKGPESSTCQHHSCLLTSSDCIPFTPKEKQELSDQTKKILFTVATTGKCMPSRDTAEFCTKAGYCDYFDMFGVTDDARNPVCDRLSKEEYADLISRLRPQPDGSIDVDLDKSVKRDSPPYETRFKMVKRTLGKRSDAITVGADEKSKVSPAHGADNSADVDAKSESSLNKRALLRAKLDVPAPAASSDDDDKITFFGGVRVDQLGLAQHILEYAHSSLGSVSDLYGHRIVCEGAKSDPKQPGSEQPQGEKAADCYVEVCTVSKDQGCEPPSQAELAAFETKFRIAYTRLFYSGSCDPAVSQKDGNCDASGWCQLWLSDNKRDPSCKELTSEQSHERLRAILYELSGANDAELKEKAHPGSASTADDTITFEGAQLTQAQLAQQVVGWAVGTMSHDTMIDGVGQCKIGTEGCQPLSEEEAAALEAKYEIILTRAMFSGACEPKVSQKDGNCDRFGRCQLWLSNGKHDQHCNVLDKRQLYRTVDSVGIELGGWGAPLPPLPKAGQDGGSGDGKVKREVHLDERALFNEFDSINAKVKRDLALFDGEVHARAIQSMTQDQIRDVVAQFTSWSFDRSSCGHLYHQYGEIKLACLRARQRVSTAVYSVFVSGACDASADDSRHCNEQGQCNLFLKDGRRNKYCRRLTDDEMDARLGAALDELDKQADEEPALIVVPGSPDITAADDKADNRKQKRDAALKRDLFNGQAGSVSKMIKRAFASSADDDNKAILLGQPTSEMDARYLADDAAAKSMKHTDVTGYDREQVQEAQRALSDVMFVVLTSGRCDTTDADPANCDKMAGWCKLWVEHKRDHRCRTLTKKEIIARFDDLEAWGGWDLPETSASGAAGQGASSGKTAGKPQKRDVHLKRVLSDDGAESVYAKIKREVDSNSANYPDASLTEEQAIQRMDEAVEGVFAAGYEVPGHSQKELRRTLRKTVVSIYTSGKCDISKGGNNCDATGRCKLWVNHVRDHGCSTSTDEEMEERFMADWKKVLASYAAEDASSGAKNDDVKRQAKRHLIKRVVSQEPVRQELLKRVQSPHGDRRQVMPDYLTVPASSLTSESGLYQPDPQEVWQVQNAFREISKNPAAVREIANYMGIYKDEDIKSLAEHYAMLADNPSETIKVIQRFMLAEEVTESKSLVGSEHGGKRAKEMAEGVEKLSQ